MRYIALFESITGATTRDCLIETAANRIVFITKERQAGLAVGRDGANVKTLRRMMGRNIEIIEYSENAAEFIKNTFNPARVKEVRITDLPNGKKIAKVTVEPKDKGVAIGRGGEKVERTRQLARRYFDIDNVIIN